MSNVNNSDNSKNLDKNINLEELIHKLNKKYKEINQVVNASSSKDLNNKSTCTKFDVMPLTLLLQELYNLLNNNLITKKKLTEFQSNIEDTLFNLIINSNSKNSFFIIVNNNYVVSYIMSIFNLLFNKGLSTRISDLINKFIPIINSSKYNNNTKEVIIYLLGSILTKSTSYKAPNINDVIKELLKLVKNTSNDNKSVKKEAMNTLCKIIDCKLPNTIQLIPDIFKMIIKLTSDNKLINSFNNSEYCSNLIPNNSIHDLNLSLISGFIYYINNTTVSNYYEQLIAIFVNYFESDDIIIRNKVADIYVELHINKIFDAKIDTSNIKRRKITEPQKNFIEVLYCFAQLFIFENNNTSINFNVNFNFKHSLLIILKKFIESYSDYLNNYESLVIKLLDLMLNHFQIIYQNFANSNKVSLPNKYYIYSNNNYNSKNNISEQNQIAYELEELYKTYIKVIYKNIFRKNLLKYIMNKLTRYQGKLDKLENIKLKLVGMENIDFKLKIDKRTGKEIKDVSNMNNSKEISNNNSNNNNNNNNNNISQRDYISDVKANESAILKEIGFNEGQINALLICLIEFSEHNYDIFEQLYPNGFNDISKTLLIYLTSNIKAFRILVNRVLINFSYYIPSYRLSILALIINLSSVAHIELASLKNNLIYFVNEHSNEYKYSTIIKNNLELLKDITNCLGVCLSTFSYKSLGISVDLSSASLTAAKNIIIGKFADEDHNIKALSLKEKANKYNYLNSEIDSHKEAGWIIIQGLSSMDYSWLTDNFKPLFQLWKYIFNEESCLITKNEEEMLKAPLNSLINNSSKSKHSSNNSDIKYHLEFKEAFVSEFYVKKAALAALRKFIISCKDFINSENFETIIPQLLDQASKVFIEKKNVIDFCNTYLKEEYRDLKVILYDCYYSIPTKLFQYKFNDLLNTLCEDIASSDYYNSNCNTNNLVFCEYVYNHINYFDTLFCDYMLNSNFSKNKIINIESINNMFHIDHFFIEKYDVNLTNKLNNSVSSNNNSYSKLVDSSINLLVEILLDQSKISNNNNINSNKSNDCKSKVCNKHQIIKHFLTNINDLSGNNFNNLSKISKSLNIVYAIYLLLKKGSLRKINVIDDESIFTSVKMIFDIGLKIENNIVNRISAESHALLIRLSNNPRSNVYYYLLAIDCKFKNYNSSKSTGIIKEDVAFSLYIIANIMRLNEFSNIDCLFNTLNKESVFINSGTDIFDNDNNVENNKNKNVSDIITKNKNVINILNYSIELIQKLLIKSSLTIEDVINPYVSQSFLIICEALIINKKLDEVRKIIEYYEQYYLYINYNINLDKLNLIKNNILNINNNFKQSGNNSKNNNSNNSSSNNSGAFSILNTNFGSLMGFGNNSSNYNNKDNEALFYKDVQVRHYFCEIKLLVVWALLGNNINKEEVNKFKISFERIINDNVHNDSNIRLLFLYLIKIVVSNFSNTDNSNSLYKYIDTSIIDYVKSIIINYNFKKEEISGPFYECKLAIEILINLLLQDNNNRHNISWFEFINHLINKLNLVYNFNRNSYFMDEIFNKVYNYPKSNEFIYSNTTCDNKNYLISEDSCKVLSKIFNIIELNKSNVTNPTTVITDAINPNYTLIKHMKLILKIYIEKNTLNNITNIVNIIKELISNSSVFYEQCVQVEGSDIKAEINNKSNNNISTENNNFISIRKMKYYIHVELKKYIIKQFINCIRMFLASLKLKISNNLNNKEAYSNNNNNNNNVQEVMNILMISTLNLITSSEESFEIKQYGLNLVIEIIDTFKKYKDTRVDDYALLIQEYEAQIISCIKSVFNTSHSILAPYAGLKILYKFITIPITTEAESIEKRINQNVDILNLKNSLNVKSFCEKYDYLYVCKKLVFFCFLYYSKVSTELLFKYNIPLKDINTNKTKELFEVNSYFINYVDLFENNVSKIYFNNNINNEISIDRDNSIIFKKCIDDIEIYPKENKNYYTNLNNYLDRNKLLLLFNNLCGIIEDAFVVYTYNKQNLKTYNSFNFMYSGNRITFCNNKLLKYSQIFINTLSILVNDINFIDIITDISENNECKYNIDKSINGKNFVSLLINTIRKNKNYLNKTNFKEEESIFDLNPIVKLLIHFMFYNSDFIKNNKKDNYAINSYNKDLLSCNNNVPKTNNQYIIYSKDEVDDFLKENINKRIIIIKVFVTYILNVLKSKIIIINDISIFDNLFNFIETSINLCSIELIVVLIDLLDVIVQKIKDGLYIVNNYTNLYDIIIKYVVHSYKIINIILTSLNVNNNLNNNDNKILLVLFNICYNNCLIISDLSKNINNNLKDNNNKLTLKDCQNEYLKIYLLIINIYNTEPILDNIKVYASKISNLIINLINMQCFCVKDNNFLFKKINNNNYNNNNNDDNKKCTQETKEKDENNFEDNNSIDDEFENVEELNHNNNNNIEDIKSNSFINNIKHEEDSFEIVEEDKNTENIDKNINNKNDGNNEADLKDEDSNSFNEVDDNSNKTTEKCKYNYDVSNKDITDESIKKEDIIDKNNYNSKAEEIKNASLNMLEDKKTPEKISKNSFDKSINNDKSINKSINRSDKDKNSLNKSINYDDNNNNLNSIDVKQDSRNNSIILDKSDKNYDNILTNNDIDLKHNENKETNTSNNIISINNNIDSVINIKSDTIEYNNSTSKNVDNQTLDKPNTSINSNKNSNNSDSNKISDKFDDNSDFDFDEVEETNNNIITVKVSNKKDSPRIPKDVGKPESNSSKSGSVKDEFDDDFEFVEEDEDKNNSNNKSIIKDKSNSIDKNIEYSNDEIKKNEKDTTTNKLNTEHDNNNTIETKDIKNTINTTYILKQDDNDKKPNNTEQEKDFDNNNTNKISKTEDDNTDIIISDNKQSYNEFNCSKSSNKIENQFLKETLKEESNEFAFDEVEENKSCNSNNNNNNISISNDINKEFKNSVENNLKEESFKDISLNNKSNTTNDKQNNKNSETKNNQSYIDKSDEDNFDEISENSNKDLNENITNNKKEVASSDINSNSKSINSTIQSDINLSDYGDNINLFQHIIELNYELIHTILFNSLQESKHENNNNINNNSFDKYLMIIYANLQSLIKEDALQNNLNYIKEKTIVLINTVLNKIKKNSNKYINNEKKYNCVLKLFQYMIKGFFLSIKSLANNNIYKEIIYHFISIVNNSDILSMIAYSNEEYISLIIVYVISCNSTEYRQMMLSLAILNIIKYYKEIKTKISNDKLSELIIRLTSKENDISLLKNFAQFIDKELLLCVDKFYKLKQQANLQKSNYTDNNNKNNASQKVSNSNNNLNNKKGFNLGIK